MSVSVDNLKAYITSGNPTAPESIKRFDLVSKISVGLSILGFLISLFGHPVMMMMAGGGVVTGLIILALYVFLFYMIVMEAKEWAKWVYTILFGIGFIGMIMSIGMMSIGFMFIFGSMIGLINLVQIALGAYAVFLLFQPDSTRFFKSA